MLGLVTPIQPRGGDYGRAACTYIINIEIAGIVFFPKNVCFSEKKQ